MNEQIQDHFSCADWIVIPASVREYVAGILGLTFISQDEKWENNLILCTTYGTADNYLDDLLQRIDKVLVSSSINGYYIIEGKCLRYIYKTLCDRLSADCGIYFFSIDLWECRSNYVYYINRKEMRFYCAELDATGNFHEEDRGNILTCEKDAELKIPTIEIDGEQSPNYWFLPLGVMFNLGITDSEVLQALNEPCSIYTLENSDLKMVKDILLERK